VKYLRIVRIGNGLAVATYVIPFMKKSSATTITPELYCSIPTSGYCSISLTASSKQSSGTMVSESTV
jgi:hypothetical protein